MCGATAIIFVPYQTLREFEKKKIISITPFVNKSPSYATTIAKDCNKVNKKVNISIYDFKKK